MTMAEGVKEPDAPPDDKEKAMLRAMRSSKAVRLLVLTGSLSFAVLVAGRIVDSTGRILLGNHIADPGQLIFFPAIVGLAAAAVGWRVRDEGKEYWWAVVLSGGILTTFFLLPAFLLFLVTNGNGNDFWTFFDWYSEGSGILVGIELILMLLITGLVIAVPAFLGRTSGWAKSPQSEKEIVLAWFAVGASLAAGLFVFLLDFVLTHARRIPPGQFSVAILFAVALLVPILKSVASKCSELGIVGVCDPVRFWNRERKAAKALTDAFASWRDAHYPSDNEDGNDAGESLGDS